MSAAGRERAAASRRPERSEGPNSAIVELQVSRSLAALGMTVLSTAVPVLTADHGDSTEPMTEVPTRTARDHVNQHQRRSVRARELAFARPVFTHPDCLRHDPGPDHPETPARLRVLLERVRADRALDVRSAAAGSDRRPACRPSPGLSRESRGDERPRRRRDLPGHRPQRRELGSRARGDGRDPGRRRPTRWRDAATPSRPCGRPGITRSPRGRWASAWCPTPSSPRAMPSAPGATAC